MSSITLEATYYIVTLGEMEGQRGKCVSHPSKHLGWHGTACVRPPKVVYGAYGLAWTHLTPF